MRCTYQKNDSVQQIALVHDNTLPFAVQLACLEKGLNIVRSHDKTGQEGKVQFGIKTGLNLAILSASINSDSKFKPGFHIGIYIKAPIGRNVFFRPEIYYSRQGQIDNYSYNTGVSAGKTTTTLNYINIPLLFEFGKKVTFQTGLQPGILCVAREKGTISNRGVNDDLKKFMKSADVSLVLGLGANFTPNINAGIRANIGLSDIFLASYQPYPGLDFPNVANRVFHFFVAYSF